MECIKGTCMMCLEGSVEIRHVNLYVVGSEGLYCCRSCEDKVLEFIRGKMREATKGKIKVHKGSQGEGGEEDE